MRRREHLLLVLSGFSDSFAGSSSIHRLSPSFSMSLRSCRLWDISSRTVSPLSPCVLILLSRSVPPTERSRRSWDIMRMSTSVALY